MLLFPTVALAGNISVAWDPVPEADALGYVVYVSTQPGAAAQAIDVGNATTFTYSAAAPGVTYYFSVAAYGAGLVVGPRSSEISGKVAESPDPAMVIDSPSSGSRVGVSMSIAGWAIDRGAASGSGVDAIHAYAYPRVGSGFGSGTLVGVGTTGVARPDVGAVIGSQFSHSGFSVPAAVPAAGEYRLVVYAHSTVSGTFNQARVVDVTVGTDANPVMVIDTPINGASPGPSFTLAGWAVDRGAIEGTGVDAVHVWAAPAGGSAILVGAPAYGTTRSDIGALYGSRFANSGYSLTVSGLAPGTYTLTAYAHSTVTGTFNQSRSVVVTIPVSDPVMVVDTPATGAATGQVFTISGWAVDRSGSSGPGVDAVHVYANPIVNGVAGSGIFLGGAITGLARPDVGAALGSSRFNNSGYALSVSGILPAGSYRLTVFARSTVTGTFNQARVIDVIVR